MIKYRSDIDGLRAIAVILVIFFHFSMGFPGGFIGVDIFFVISGYLITHLIKASLDRGTFTLGSFWMRRIRRLFPALGVMVLINIIASYFILYPNIFRDYGKELIAQLCMISNIYYAQQDGYFATSSEYLPLLHTWSLAVEEQFYLIFPILLIYLNKKSSFRKQKAVKILLLVATASFVINLFGATFFQYSNFFLILGRAWELLLGSLIALTRKKDSAKLYTAEILVWTSFCTLIFCALTYDNSVVFPGLAAVPVCLATAIIIHVHSERQTALSRIISCKPVVYIGKISYSLYLWHWPIYVFLNYTSTENLNYVDTFILIIASFIAACFSYHLIEQPVRKGVLSNRYLVKILLGFTLLGIVAGTIFYKAGGLESRFSKNVLNYANASGKWSDKIRNNTTLPIPDNSGKLVPVLLWGDSHAAHIAPALNKICIEKGVKMHVITKGGTPPFVNSTTEKRPNLSSINNEVIEFILSESIQHVVLVSKWNAYHLKKEHLINLDYPDEINQRAFEICFKQTVERLIEVGVNIWIVRQVPHQKQDPPRILANAVRYKNKILPSGITIQEHTRIQSTANNVIDRLKQPGVHILDPTPYFFQKGDEKCILSIGGMSLYRDFDHLSPEGAIMLAPIFKPIFNNLNTE